MTRPSLDTMGTKYKKTFFDFSNIFETKATFWRLDLSFGSQILVVDGGFNLKSELSQSSGGVGRPSAAYCDQESTMQLT